MGLFGKKPSKSFLGVDIGSSGIKVVEVDSARGRPVLMTYGYAEISATEAGDFLFDQPQQTGALLARVCREAGTHATAAMAALPTSHVFSAILSLSDQMKDERARRAAVEAEASKLSPLPLSQMILQTTYLDEERKQETGKKEKHLRVMATGSAKSFIQKYIEIFKAAKLDLQAIDTEALALVRSLVGKDKGAILIIDVGAKRTTIIVVEKGIPFVSRSIQLGGETVTYSLMERMHLAREEAERVKRDLGIASTRGSGQVGDVSTLAETILSPLLSEIRYAFQLYANMEFAQIKTIEKIILTGGSSHLPGMVESLSHALNLNVYRGDPWARVVFAQDLSHVLEEIGPRMSVAVGLAMRELE